MGETPVISEAAGRLSRTMMASDDIGRLRYASRFVSDARRDKHAERDLRNSEDTGERTTMQSRRAGEPKGTLQHLGLTRIRDLLLHVPSRYSDYTRVVPIVEADVGFEATIIATVDKITLKTPRPKLQLVEVYVLDKTGIMQLAFFRQPWVAKQLKPGEVIAFSGKVSFAYGFKQMTPKYWERISNSQKDKLARIVPTYPTTEGISSGWMRRLIAAALADAGDVCDFLPAGLIARRHLPCLARALRDVHFPYSLAAGIVARRRLAYDEMLCLQLALLTRQRLACANVAPWVHVIDGARLHATLNDLPFKLSEEQQKAIDEVLDDMAAPRVMNRLLLGDVGTGKTVVATCALMAATDSATQAVMMAPTSVLATQYAEKIGPALDKVHVSWELLLGSTSAAERTRIAQALKTGECEVVFGTTALLSKDITFRALSLIVVDEQHRFGVDQRGALRRAGPGADMLTMTATPIPRTLALTLYGDMSCSRIVHRPYTISGAKTSSISPENLDLAYGALRDAVGGGHQAYVVCPLVDEKDDGSALDDVPTQTRSASKPHSVAQVVREISRQVPEAVVGSLTGRMRAADKARAMEDFRAGKTQILVCTTVIEVGIDVQNATVMVIYDADRFGLATLHQLRGRVGRGKLAGSVYLMCAARKGTPARRRLDALESSSDGFALAELDLKLRHEGEVLGYRQSGEVTLRISDLSVDRDLAIWARDDARAIVKTDPALRSALHRSLALEVRERFGAYFEEVEGR